MICLKNIMCPVICLWANNYQALLTKAPIHCPVYAPPAIVTVIKSCAPFDKTENIWQICY